MLSTKIDSTLLLDEFWIKHESRGKKGSHIWQTQLQDNRWNRMYSLCYKSRPEAIDMFSQFACTLRLLCQLRQGGFFPQGIILLHRLVSMSMRQRRESWVETAAPSHLLPTKRITHNVLLQTVYICMQQLLWILFWEVGCRVTPIRWLWFPVDNQLSH